MLLQTTAQQGFEGKSKGISRSQRAVPVCLGTLTSSGGKNSACRGTIPTLVPQANILWSLCVCTETLLIINCGSEFWLIRTACLLVAHLLKHRDFVA